jgi:hypothetical protein
MTDQIALDPMPEPPNNAIVRLANPHGDVFHYERDDPQRRPADNWSGCWYAVGTDDDEIFWPSVLATAAGLGMSIERLYRSEESRARFVAWLRSPQGAAVLVAHQRTDTSGCHCGWGRLGHSHAAHVLAALAEEASRDR